jgi:hypothetical protein
MLAQGFRASVTGVQMFYRNDPAYNTPDAFIIDDLR